MISAKVAREKTESSRLSLTRASVERAIKKAVGNGRDYIRLTTALNKEFEAELTENGYKVEQMNGLTKISW